VAIGYLKTSHKRGVRRMRRRGAEPSCRSSRHYEAFRAHRQYYPADPDNCNTTRQILTIVWSWSLVMAEPGQRWNARLVEVRALEAELAGLTASAETPLTQFECERLIALGADVESA
jgi:hypothetical protein